MTYFYKACSAVLTCVGTGSSLGSISKGRRKQFLEVFSPERTQGSRARIVSVLLVSDKWPLPQATPWFVCIYRFLLMDTRSNL